MPFEALKCPSCGATLKSQDVMKCEYCGAALFYFAPQQTFTTKPGEKCPNCQTMNEAGRQYCKKCMGIFTDGLPHEEVEKLFETQRRVRFKEEQARDALPPNILAHLAPQEFIHYVFHHGDKTYCELVTNKRIIHYHFHKHSRLLGMAQSEEFWEEEYKNIVSFAVNQQTDNNYTTSNHSLALATYAGERILTMDTTQRARYEAFLRIVDEAKDAWQRYNARIIDPNIVFRFGTILLPPPPPPP